MITRNLTKIIVKNHKSGFISVIYGARRTGKTVLLNQILTGFPNEKILSFNGDLTETRTTLKTSSEVALTNLVQNYSIIAIDEAQRIRNIGLSLKIIIDKFPDKKIFITGSSSLSLAKGVHESLTGRTLKYVLYPLSTVELSQNLEKHQIPFLLPDQLIYGSYPHLQNLSLPSEKISYLNSIVDDYLFNDLFELKHVDNPDLIKKLATLLAFQIGSEVSSNELARQLSISDKTVSRYLHLLEKCFIIFKVGAYSRNLRSELSRPQKYCFYDLGIRNALINQFQALDSRSDLGRLWENFLAVERLKYLQTTETPISYYFWRDYSQAEIDWIEQHPDSLKAFEFKYSKAYKKTPVVFAKNYGVELQTINRDNYLDFILI